MFYVQSNPYINLEFVQVLYCKRISSLWSIATTHRWARFAGQRNLVGKCDISNVNNVLHFALQDQGYVSANMSASYLLIADQHNISRVVTT